MRRVRANATSVGLAVGAGLLLACGFPPFDLAWPAVLVAVALWFVVTDGRSIRATLGLSFLFAAAFNLLLLRWMLVVGRDAWLALSLLEGCFFLPVAIARKMASGPSTAVVVVGLVWPAADWLRDHAGMLAFGWGQLSFASVGAPWSALSPWLGQWGTTAFVVCAAGLLAAIVRSGATIRITALGALLLSLSLPLLIAEPPAPAPSGRRIALVQAGVGQTGIGHTGDRRDVMRRNVTLTMAHLSRTEAELVVWPENSVDVDPFADAEARTSIPEAADVAGAPILFGALLESPTHRRNATVLSDGNGLRIVYVKQRLVPFGEYLPARELIARFTRRHELIPRDFVSGHTAAQIAVGSTRIGLVICFEIADDSLVHAALNGGVSALLLQTNNATFAGWGQSEQQLRIAQFRARSLRIPVFMVSTNGPTAVIDAAGRVLHRIAEGSIGIINADLPTD